MVDAVGALSIERCVIQSFTGIGILFQPAGKLSVKDTVSRNNGSFGLSVFVNSGTAQAVIDRSQFLSNNGGVSFQGTGTAEATVTDSIFVGNGANGFEVFSGRVILSRTIAANNNVAGFSVSGGQVTLERCIARGNVQAGMETISTGTIRVSNSISTLNGTSFRQLGGTFFSRSALNNSAAPGTNTVNGNTTNVSGVITYYNGN